MKKTITPDFLIRNGFVELKNNEDNEIILKKNGLVMWCENETWRCTPIKKEDRISNPSKAKVYFKEEIR